MEILNRIARHNYFVLDTLECGIMLSGTEIKSIRDGKCQIKDSYAIVRNNELYLLNMYIAPYKEGSIFNQNETRTRKLLVHKNEILKLYNKTKIEGNTLIPLRVYFNDKNKAKVELGICKGKKNFDKRETEKERSIKRDLDKARKDRL